MRSYEEDIKQNLPGSTNHGKFLVIFAGAGLKIEKKMAQLFQVLIHFFPGLSSFASDGRKQFQFLNYSLND